MDKDLHNEDNLESFFRKSLEDFEDEPSEDLWDRIEVVIPPKPVPVVEPTFLPTPPKALWIKYLAAAAVTIAIVGAVVGVFSLNEKIKDIGEKVEAIEDNNSIADSSHTKQKKSNQSNTSSKASQAVGNQFFNDKKDSLNNATGKSNTNKPKAAKKQTNKLNKVNKPKKPVKSSSRTPKQPNKTARVVSTRAKKQPKTDETIIENNSSKSLDKAFKTADNQVAKQENAVISFTTKESTPTNAKSTDNSTFKQRDYLPENKNKFVVESSEKTSSTPVTKEEKVASPKANTSPTNIAQTTQEKKAIIPSDKNNIAVKSEDNSEQGKVKPSPKANTSPTNIAQTTQEKKAIVPSDKNNIAVKSEDNSEQGKVKPSPKANTSPTKIAQTTQEKKAIVPSDKNNIAVKSEDNSEQGKVKPSPKANTSPTKIAQTTQEKKAIVPSDKNNIAVKSDKANPSTSVTKEEKAVKPSPKANTSPSNIAQTVEDKKTVAPSTESKQSNGNKFVTKSEGDLDKANMDESPLVENKQSDEDRTIEETVSKKNTREKIEITEIEPIIQAQEIAIKPEKSTTEKVVVSPMKKLPKAPSQKLAKATKMPKLNGLLSGFFVDTYAGANAEHRVLKDGKSKRSSGGGGRKDRLNKNEDIDLAWQTGARVGYHVNDRWTLYTGVGYARKEQKAKHNDVTLIYEEETPNSTEPVSVATKYTLESSYGDTDLNINFTHRPRGDGKDCRKDDEFEVDIFTEQQTTFISVPLLAEFRPFRLSKSPFQFSFIGGLQSNFLVDKSLTINNIRLDKKCREHQGFDDRLTYDNVNIDENEVFANLSNQTFDLQFGLGLRFIASHRLGLWLEPSYQRSLSPIYTHPPSKDDEFETKTFPQSYNLNFGIRYHF